MSTHLSDADLSVMVTVVQRPHLHAEFCLTEPFMEKGRQRYPEAYVEDAISRMLKETESALRKTFEQLNDRCAPGAGEFEWEGS